jgi:hypothetical protein
LFGIGKSKNSDGVQKLPGPKNIPELVARYMVQKMGSDSVWTWDLTAVAYPTGKKAAYYRVYDNGKTSEAKVKVKNWISLDGHPELIMFEGYCNDETGVCRQEKFEAPVVPSASSK